MDYVLDYAEDLFLTPYVYGDDCSWVKSDIRRQFVSLSCILTWGGLPMYLIPATVLFYVSFDRNLMKHPLFLKGQIRREVTTALKSIPFLGVLTASCVVFEVRGHSRLYDDVSDNRFGLLGCVLECLCFVVVTDAGNYAIHRLLHLRLLYTHIHKTHHNSKISTPFASHAIHPVDGFLQSLPYHAYAFLVPMHKVCFLLMFVVMNLWTVSVHDGNFDPLPRVLQPYFNGVSHHAEHHVYHRCNFGQYFTLCDRLFGSYRVPRTSTTQTSRSRRRTKETEIG